MSLNEARSVSEAWRVVNSERRPHRNLTGTFYQTPTESATMRSSKQLTELSL